MNDAGDTRVARSRASLSRACRSAADALFDRSRGPVAYAMRTAAFSWTVTMALLLSLRAFDVLPDAEPPVTGGPVAIVLGLLIAAPLVENALMFGVLRLLSRMTSAAGIVVTVAIVAGLAHWFDGRWRFIAGTIQFGVMAYTSLVWSDRPTAWRYRLTVLQHALFNAPATALLIADTMP